MHRWSKLFIPTLREAPADAEVASHKLLLRAGYIRQLGAGIYSYLPLGQRSLNKIIAIVRDEMDKIGQQFLLPALNPVELWQESGRETVMGQNLFHLKDRKNAELVLAMTHEEVITSIARNEIRSYKQLPQIWYQIQNKFRDEPRPKGGLLRVRQFTMKDSYSFDIDATGLDLSYRKHDAAYRAIFTRCGLPFVVVEADSGSMGGSQSQEFMVYTDAGEDLIASSASGYAANLEKATSTLATVEDLAASSAYPVRIHTPGFRTIDEVAAYLNQQHHAFSLPSSNGIGGDAIKRHHQIKTMAYMVLRGYSMTGQENWVPVAAFLRGDHSLNETKLLGVLSGREARPMTPEEISEYFKAPAGYLGPIGLQPKQVINKGSALPAFTGEGDIVVILDAALKGRTNLIAGANEEDYHLRDVTPDRDFQHSLVADIRNINEGDPDPIEGQPLRIGKAVEIGHIFKLGYKYSESMGARVLDGNGKEVMPIMGCYGIGIERILTAAIESSAAAFKTQFPDIERTGEQYVLSPSIAPYEVIVTITNIKEEPLLKAGETLAAELSKASIDVLLDDRDERAGVKFKDAELIGVPYRINIGKKLAEGFVELVDRLNGTTLDITLDTVTTHLQSLLAASKP